MMNGPMCSSGFESALKSGTSLPTHFCAVSFHHTCLRDGSYGLPVSRRKRGCTARAGSRPRPPPVQVEFPARRDRRYRALHHCTGFRPGAAIEPVAARSRAVIVQQGEPRQLLSGFQRCFAFVVVKSASALPLISFATSEATDFRIGVIPGRLQDRIGELAAFLLIQFAIFRKICARCPDPTGSLPAGAMRHFSTAASGPNSRMSRPFRQNLRPAAGRRWF